MSFRSAFFKGKTAKISVSALVVVAISALGVVAPATAKADTAPTQTNPAMALAVNVPGELLTAAAAGSDGMFPGKTAAIMANKVKYNWSWTNDPTLSAVSGNSPALSTKARLRYSKSAAVTAATSTFSAPATLLAPPTQIVNGTSTGIFGAAARAAGAAAAGIALGSGVDRLMGVDVTGGLCASGPSALYDGFNAVLASLTVSNCQAWQTTQAMKTGANSDLSSTTLIGTGEQSCSATGCATIYGAVTAYPDREQIYCVAATSGDMLTVNRPTNGAYTHLSNGDYWWLGGPNYEATPRWGCPSYPGAVAYAGLSVHLNGPNPAVVWRANEGAGVVEGTSVTDNNPDRRFICDVEYASGASSSDETGPFTQSTTSFPIPKCPAVPADQIPVSVTIYETSPFGNFDIWSSSVTDAYQDWKAEYPECSNGSCLLDLRKDGASCFDSPGDCATWLSDSDAAAHYSCVYGTHAMALSSCNLYGNIFDLNKVAAGDGYVDPATGGGVGQTTQTEEDELAVTLLDRGWGEPWGPTPTYQLQTGVGDQAAAARKLAKQCIALNLDKQCSTEPIFSPGNNIQEAALHDMNAILGTFDAGTNGALPQPAELTWIPKEDRVSRDWYRTVMPCSGNTDTAMECDEYPFNSTAEAGPGAAPPTTEASLKVIDRLDNRKEGLYLGHFYKTCGVDDSARVPDGKFVVVPLPQTFANDGSNTVAPGLPTSMWCSK